MGKIFGQTPLWCEYFTLMPVLGMEATVWSMVATLQLVDGPKRKHARVELGESCEQCVFSLIPLALS